MLSNRPLTLVLMPPTAGSDYKATRLLVSFKPGGFAQEVVSITILDDSTAEGKEDFRAELSVSQGQTGVVLGEASIAVIEVVDDDVGRFISTAMYSYSCKHPSHTHTLS